MRLKVVYKVRLKAVYFELQAECMADHTDVSHTQTVHTD